MSRVRLPRRHHNLKRIFVFVRRELHRVIAALGGSHSPGKGAGFRQIHQGSREMIVLLFNCFSDMTSSLNGIFSFIYRWYDRLCFFFRHYFKTRHHPPEIIPSCKYHLYYMYKKK